MRHEFVDCHATELGAMAAYRVGELAQANNRTFLMSWMEEGGPSVAAPIQKGFGQKVIGRMVESAVEGTVEVGYQESGFSWKLSAPVADALEGRQVPSESDAS